MHPWAPRPEKNLLLPTNEDCARGMNRVYQRPIYFMSKKTKTKSATETKQKEQAQLLALLKQVLPKAAPDPALAERIYQAFEAELKAKNQAVSFKKFCDRLPLPDLESQTLDEVKLQLAAFSPTKKKKASPWKFPSRMERNSARKSNVAPPLRKKATSRKSRSNSCPSPSACRATRS